MDANPDVAIPGSTPSITGETLQNVKDDILGCNPRAVPSRRSNLSSTFQYSASSGGRIWSITSGGTLTAETAIAGKFIRVEEAIMQWGEQRST
jgi:hypothetical protein